MRKTASIASIGLGIIMIIASIVTWVMVSSTLADQRITVSEDADCAAGAQVKGPISAFCQARIIDKHTLDATEGKTYAELDQDDPLRETAMNSAFLQASLFTSVVSFGIAAMAAAMGLLFILIGLGIRDVSARTGPSPTADTGA